MNTIESELQYIESHFTMNKSLRRQLHHLMDHAEDERIQIRHLQDEIRRLRKKLMEYEQEFGIRRMMRRFVEARGAIFVQSMEGEYSHVPHCPNCKTMMTAFKGGGPFCCDKCFWIADFTEEDLDQIISGLPE